MMEYGEEVSTINHTFDDYNMDIENIEVPEGIEAYSMRIYIESVYTNNRKYSDTCISDLVIYGEILN